MNGVPQVMMQRDPRGFVRARAPADASFKWMLAAVDEIATDLTKETARLLLDLSAVSHPPHTTEQAILGEHVARQLSRCKRVASLVGEGTHTGISEAVAWSFGVDLRVFECEASAIAWVLAD